MDNVTINNWITHQIYCPFGVRFIRGEKGSKNDTSVVAQEGVVIVEMVKKRYKTKEHSLH